MPKTARLTGRDLRSIRPTARLHGVLFSLSLLPLPSRMARATIVVSKAVAAKAVDRNLIKRRARSLVLPLMKTAQSAGYVFTAKKAAVGASYAALREDLRELVARSRAAS